jgi:hypothetical protein
MTRATLLTLLLIPATTALGDDSLRFMRVLHVEGAVLVQRGEDEPEPADRNLPLLPGDRVFTAESARAELQIADGTLLRLDEQSQLTFFHHEVDEAGFDRLAFRLWSGGVDLVVGGWQRAGYDIETAHGWIVLSSPAQCRIVATRQGTTVTVLAGELRLIGGGGDVPVADGQAATVSNGRPPKILADISRLEDANIRWNASRRGSPLAEQSLPKILWPYAEELDRHGDWIVRSDLDLSVWRPYVRSDWQPFLHGRWYWTADGWAWVAEEPWGWAPFHCGRWSHTDGLGWHWIPDEEFAPARVTWEQDEDYIGWAPLYEDMVIAADVWVYTHRRDFRNRDIYRCHLRRRRGILQNQSREHHEYSAPRRPTQGSGAVSALPPPQAEPSKRPSERLAQSSDRHPSPTPTALLPRKKPATFIPRKEPELSGAERRHPTPRASASSDERRKTTRPSSVEDDAERKTSAAARQADDKRVEREKRAQQEREAQARLEQERREAEQREARRRIEQALREAKDRAEREKRAQQEQEAQARLEQGRREAEYLEVKQRVEQALREAEERAEREKRDDEDRERKAREEREQREAEAAAAVAEGNDKKEQKANITDALKRRLARPKRD